MGVAGWLAAIDGGNWWGSEQVAVEEEVVGEVEVERGKATASCGCIPVIFFLPVNPHIHHSTSAEMQCCRGLKIVH